MKALSLWEPWASLWAAGVKVHETRSWATSYRGPLLVHAAKKWDAELRGEADFWLSGPIQAAGLEDRFLSGGRPPSLGCIVGIVDLVDCGRVVRALVPASHSDQVCGNWHPGRYAWRAENPVLFPEPIPCRGAQGLWAPPAEVVRAVEAIR